MWDQKSGVLTSNHKINNKNTNKQENNIEETKNTKENQNEVQICIKKKVIDKLIKLGIQWFCASMEEVVALPSEQNIVKTF